MFRKLIILLPLEKSTLEIDTVISQQKATIFCPIFTWTGLQSTIIHT